MNTTTEKRVKLLHLLGEFTHDAYTLEEFKRDIANIPDANNEFIRAFHDGDIEVGDSVKVSAAGRIRLAKWAGELK